MFCKTNQHFFNLWLIWRRYTFLIWYGSIALLHCKALNFIWMKNSEYNLHTSTAVSKKNTKKSRFILNWFCSCSCSWNWFVLLLLILLLLLLLLMFLSLLKVNMKDDPPPYQPSALLQPHPSSSSSLSLDKHIERQLMVQELNNTFVPRFEKIG